MHFSNFKTFHKCDVKGKEHIQCCVANVITFSSEADPDSLLSWELQFNVCLFKSQL